MKVYIPSLRRGVMGGGLQSDFLDFRGLQNENCLVILNKTEEKMQWY